MSFVALSPILEEWCRAVDPYRWTREHMAVMNHVAAEANLIKNNYEGRFEPIDDAEAENAERVLETLEQVESGGTATFAVSFTNVTLVFARCDESSVDFRLVDVEPPLIRAQVTRL